MKAIVYTQYGAPDVLRLQEVAKPTPKDDEVLIKVHATTVTTGDVNIRGFVFVPNGMRFLTRLAFGLKKPKKTILGMELAGEVEAVGKAVTMFKPGDRVFGLDSSKMGAYAEYTCRPESSPLVVMSPRMSYEEAAAIPNGAGTALYFLRNLAKVQPGQTVLINGASGSVGSYAVQIAKHLGAHVTGVCSGKNEALVKSLGADRVIDYTREDFTKGNQTYDVILDTTGKRPFAAYKKVLTQKGRFLAVAGGMREFRQMAWTGLRGGKRLLAGTPGERKDELLLFREWFEAGIIKPVIDRCYHFSEAVEAHRHVDSGRKRGNVVITVAAK